MTWNYDGRVRPDFADPPAQGQESVWDYPRPPAIVADSRRVVVRKNDTVVADTVRALRVLETASPPTFYLPPEDVRDELLVWRSGRSFCEWKGVASYCDLDTGSERIESVGWRYSQPGKSFSELAGYVAFYPGRVECFVAGERVRPQPGRFYGGWMTDEIAGPVKGEPGTGHW